MEKIYSKSFDHQYKDAKIVSSIAIIFSLIMLISAAASEWIDKISLILLIAASLVFIYSILFIFLYWKCARYIKNNQLLPKWVRKISVVLFIFYLTFYQLNEKKYRLYLLLNEIRFWFFWILFNILLFGLLMYASYIIENTNWFKTAWFIIISIDIAFTIINLFLSIIIWKYQGTNSKLLKFLIFITLNFRNYRLYKKIIELNSEKSS